MTEQTGEIEVEFVDEVVEKADAECREAGRVKVENINGEGIDEDNVSVGISCFSALVDGGGAQFDAALNFQFNQGLKSG